MTVKCVVCDELRAYDDCHHSGDTSVCRSCEIYYQPNKGKKGTDKLNNCDVFTLKIDNEYSNHYSLIEWGRALELGKVLIVIFDFEDDVWYNFNPRLFVHLVKQSKKSFSGTSDAVKDRIIRNHTDLPISTYEEYVSYLQTYLP